MSAPVFVFDLDDTLYLERDYVASGFRAVAEHVARIHNVSAEASFRQLMDLFEAGIRGDTFDRFIADLGPSGYGLTVDDLVGQYRRHEPDIFLDEHAQQMLDVASQLGGVALITDGPATMQERKIAAMGLTERLDKIVVTAHLGLGFSKPHPAAFEMVMKHWCGTARNSFIYVGDNPTKDFIAPNALGWATLRLQHHGQLHAAVETNQSGARAGHMVASRAAVAPALCRWVSART